MLVTIFRYFCCYNKPCIFLNFCCGSRAGAADNLHTRKMKGGISILVVDQQENCQHDTRSIALMNGVMRDGEKVNNLAREPHQRTQILFPREKAR